MKQAYTLDINETKDFLLNVAIDRPVFIWGAPGIGKSSVVEQTSGEWGMECVTLLGSQLAPEDLIGIPKFTKNEWGVEVSKFIPPSFLVREKPFVLFLDELNLASPEVRKAFYSLILDKRVGELVLPKGSVIIGAGNRASDSALVSALNSTLINRMVHITMKPKTSIWLKWASENGIHPLVIDFIKENPNFLSTEVPPTEEDAFSTPRSWHAVSDIFNSYKTIPKESLLKIILQGTISQAHRSSFEGFVKLQKEKYKIYDILNGTEAWPREIEKRDILLYLTNSLRQILQKELPVSLDNASSDKKNWVHKVRKCVQSLGEIDAELCSILVAKDENDETLPSWFILELTNSSSMFKSLEKEEV